MTPRLATVFAVIACTCVIILLFLLDPPDATLPMTEQSSHAIQQFPVPGSVRVTPGQVLDHETNPRSADSRATIESPAHGSISLMVLHDGVPRENVPIDLATHAGKPISTQHTTASGHAVFRELKMGQYTIRPESHTQLSLALSEDRPHFARVIEIPEHSQHTISGTVVDHIDQPLKDATVHVFESLRQSDPEPTTVSDEAGYYFVSAPVTRPLVFAKLPSGQSSPILFIPGDAENLVLKIDRSRQMFDVPVLVRFDGKPLANAKVEWKSLPNMSNDSRLASNGRVLLHDSRTDEHGRFRIDGVSPGSLRIEVELKPSGGTWVGTTFIEDDRENQIDIHTQATLIGLVTDQHGMPRRNAQVSAAIPGGSQSRGRTNADGYYDMPVFELGAYEANALSGQEYATGSVNISAPGHHRLDLTLETYYALEGTVTTVHGSPLPFWKVVVSRRDGTGTKTAYTTTEGLWSVQRLREGPHTVSVEDVIRPSRRYTHTPAIVIGDRRRLDILVPEHISAEGASLRGTVIMENREPALGARVSLHIRFNEPEVAAVNDVGGFAFQDLPLGIYVLEVDFNGFPVYTHEFYVHSSEGTLVPDIVLPTPVPFSVVLSGPPDLIRSVNDVQLSDRAGRFRKSAEIHDGTASFSSLHPGIYTAVLHGSSVSEKRYDLQVSAHSSRGMIPVLAGIRVRITLDSGPDEAASGYRSRLATATRVTLSAAEEQYTLPFLPVQGSDLWTGFATLSPGQYELQLPSLSGGIEKYYFAVSATENSGPLPQEIEVRR